MKKRIVSVLLVAAMAAVLTTPALAAVTETDVTQTLRALEIMVGDETGELHLDRVVTRAEFAKLLVAASSQADAIGGEGTGYSLFTDVKSAHWASEYIKLCLDNGWMIGYTDGSFRPDNSVTLEEACTAALRLLGYDSQSLSGSFPAAQLSKAAAVGLRDDVDAVQGQGLTRRHCARIFYNLLKAKTNQGQVYANTLGYALDSNGEVDYLAVAKEDLAGPFVWSAGDELDFTPGTVYRNDRLENAAPEVGNVYYTNAKLGILWLYTDQVFGQITALSPTVGRPENVSIGGKSYTLATQEVKAKLAALGDNAVGSVATLLLGLDGAVADVQTVNGPFVASSGATLPFTPKTVYRNGLLTASAGLVSGDVYYYSADSATLWIYTDQVSGRIEALTPNAISPTAVTISGQSYVLGSNALSRQLSSLSGKWLDQYVTLLLGMDGSVVSVLSGEDVAADYYGVVQSAQKAAVDGAVEQQVTVMCTDGRTHVFSVSTQHDWDPGDLVRATVSGQSVTLVSLSSASLSGTVNKAASRVDGKTFAADVGILDTTEDGAAVSVNVSSLSDLTLSASNVRFYSLNAEGQIDRLILRNATGALWSYGYVTDVAQQGGGMNATTRYTVLLNGQSRTLSSSGKTYPVSKASGAAVRLAADGSVAAMESLKSVRLTSLGQTTAYTASQTFSVAENVQVYLKDSAGDYYAAELEDVTSAGFTLTGWYDQSQKQLRVIVAQ